MSATEALRVVLVNYNTWRECVVAVRSLLAAAPRRVDGSLLPMRIVVVDSASPWHDEAAEAELLHLLAECHGELRRCQTNMGYAAAMELGTRDARCEWLLVGNADIVFTEKSVDQLLAAGNSTTTIAAVMPLGFWDPAQEIRLPADHRPGPWNTVSELAAMIWPAQAERHARSRARTALRLADGGPLVDVGMLSGHCLLLRRSSLHGPPFDPGYPLYYEDAHLSRQLAADGHRMVQANAAPVIHLHDRSAGTVPQLKQAAERYSRRRYCRRWHRGPGAAVDVLARWLANRPWLQNLASRQIQRIPRQSSNQGKLSLPLSRPSERYLVLLGPDPWCSLPGIAFGSGDSWTMPPHIVAATKDRACFVRILDATRSELPQLAFYHLPPEHLGT